MDIGHPPNGDLLLRDIRLGVTEVCVYKGGHDKFQ